MRDFPIGHLGHLGSRVQEWVDAPGEPPQTRPAATVMIVREAQGDGAGVEAFMLTRASTMEFAPSMMVFPGGGVDTRDADHGLPWAGPSPAEWAALMDTDEDSARMLVVAAIREVFEECGVLLAGADATSIVDDVSDELWRQAREGLESRQLSFAELLEDRGLVLRTDLLRYHAHWITPEFEKRRYDTRFFAATLPTGQVAADDSREASEAGWHRPEALLERWRDGEAMLMPPTLVCVEDMARADGVEGFLADSPDVSAIMPVLVRDGDEIVLRTELPS
ncbi:NUDIX hydrolase [Actinomycetota bacterium]